MARRPNPPEQARAARPAVTRTLTPALALVAALTFSACSVTFNPGPGESAFESGTWQLGEATAPVRNTAATGTEDDSGTASRSETRADAADSGSVGDSVESGTIQVRPAPERSPDEDDGSSGTSTGTGAGSTGNGGGTGNDTGAGDVSADGDLSDPAQYARVLEAEVNQRRQAQGLSALVHDECAYAEALERAEALRQQELAHAPLEPIFERCPTSTVGENLARGGWSPAEAADGWMNSEGHRANILNSGFTRGAIACISEASSYGPQMTCAHVFLG